MTFHPWRELRHLPHLRVSLVDMPPSFLGCTNGVDTIWMDRALLQVEQRCVLAHELEHIRRGHTGHQPPRVELEVRIAAARELIRFDHLMSAAKWSADRDEMADELVVTPEVLADRIDHLEGDELRAYRSIDRP